jgi:beta-lactamase class A
MKKLVVLGTLAITVCSGIAHAQGKASPNPLQQRLEALVAKFPGRVGISVKDGTNRASISAQAPFPLQSVMKLVLAATVLDFVDQHRYKLSDKIVVLPSGLSVFVQPIAALVTPKGYSTTLGDIIHRAIVDSDNAAGDILYAKCGSGALTKPFLKAHGLSGIRVDRSERNLQTEIVGLKWRREFIIPKEFDHAIAATPKAVRDVAWKRYLADPRDTAMPGSMTAFLDALASGKLLSKESTTYLMDQLSQTKTGPDRLKAGLSGGWTLAHKTGTSGTWAGIAAATNDVGILTAPDGAKIPVSVFIANSSAPLASREALMAAVTKAVIASHKKS